MTTYGAPIVQFKKTFDFLEDLVGASSVTVYHETEEKPGFTTELHSIIRAIIRRGDDTHIAALAFRLNRVFDANGRPLDDEAQRERQQEQHEELFTWLYKQLIRRGVSSGDMQHGIVSLPYSVQLVYARRPNIYGESS